MACGRRGDAIRRVVLFAVIGSSPSLAADVGGWYAEQQKAASRAAQAPAAASCPEVIARAAADATGPAAYQAASCYLQSDPPDLVAAKAWLARSAQTNYLPAQRLLRSLLAAEADANATTRHCHDLGEGRQVCHGGAPARPLATAVTP
jgi:hypothetical protein